jgi:hypothetical protein
MHVRGALPLGTAGPNVKCAKKSRSQSGGRQYSLETTRAIFTAADHWKKRGRKTLGNGFLRFWKGFPSLLCPGEILQQSFSLQEIGSVKAFDEPTVDFCE